jgi:hypothetical protein
MEFGRGGKGKENDRASTILKCVTSVKAEDIAICIENH